MKKTITKKDIDSRELRKKAKTKLLYREIDHLVGEYTKKDLYVTLSFLGYELLKDFIVAKEYATENGITTLLFIHGVNIRYIEDLRYRKDYSVTIINNGEEK